MKDQVLVLRQAEEDIQTIFDWLARRSPVGARRWYEAYEKTLDRLESEAERFSFAPERQFFSEAIRECLFKPRSGRRYRILFVIAKSQVRMSHVRGPGQQFVMPE
jgi:plasmid stabilization system protein ParE